MRGKISRGKQPRFAPVFRLFSAPAPSARKKYSALRFSLRLPLRLPRLRLCGAGPARKKEEPPPLFCLLYILSTDTHRARFLHSAGFQPFSVEMTRTVCIFRDPFDCAGLYFQRPVRLREKTGLPKIAAKRDFWEEEEPPCRSSILPFGKMLTE